MLKENYSASVKDKIEKIIESYTQEIKLQAKRIGKRPDNQWRECVSEEALNCWAAFSEATSVNNLC